MSDFDRQVAETMREHYAAREADLTPTRSEAICYACSAGDPCPDHPRAEERVNHPAHYGGAENPYEHVKVAEALGWDKNAFVYNTTKYLWRFGRKQGTAVLEDLRKARWYLDRLISNLEKKPIEPRREATCLELGCDRISTPPRHSPYCQYSA